MQDNLTSAEKGGLRRAALLTPEERQRIAREAALTRWGDVLPRALRSGALSIAGMNIACAVLDNKVRVLTQGTFLRAIGRSRSPTAGTGITTTDLPTFLAAGNLRPFIPAAVMAKASPIKYRTESGIVAYGYDATLLPGVCGVYLDAKDAPKKTLSKSQESIASRCSILLRGFASVGIIALVDEATGWQEERAKDELSQILAHYIAPELLPWTKMFPDEFFRQIYRLQGWVYRPGTAKRTPFVGHLINRYIYEKLPPGVLDELRRLNPTNEQGHRRHRHHQFLSAETGNPHLDKQIAIVTTLMRVSRDKDQFQELFSNAFDAVTQQRLPLVVTVDEEEPAPV
jgi:hypothetical protein